MRAVAVLFFLPRETRKKICLASTPQQLSELVGVPEADLPDELRKGVEGIKDKAYGYNQTGLASGAPTDAQDTAVPNAA